MPPNTDDQYAWSDNQHYSPELQSGSAHAGGDQDLGAMTDLSGQSLVVSQTIGALTTMAQTSHQDDQSEISLSGAAGLRPQNLFHRDEMFQIYLQRPPPPSPLRNRHLSQSNSLQSDLAVQPQPLAHQQQHAEPAHQHHEDAAVDVVEPSIRDEIGQIQTTSVEDILETEEDLVDAAEEAYENLRFPQNFDQEQCAQRNGQVTPRGAPASGGVGTLALAGQSSGPSQDSQDAQLRYWMESPACSSRASQAHGRPQITEAGEGGQSGPSARHVGSLGQMSRPHGNTAAQARESAQISDNDRPNQALGQGSRIGQRTGFGGHAGQPALLRPMSPSNVSQVYHEVIENQHRSNQQTLRGFERVVQENEALKRRMSEMEVEARALREQITQMQRVMVEHSRRCPILGRPQGAAGLERGRLVDQTLPSRPDDARLPPVIDFMSCSADHLPMAQGPQPFGHRSVDAGGEPDFTGLDGARQTGRTLTAGNEPVQCARSSRLQPSTREEASRKNEGADSSR